MLPKKIEEKVLNYIYNTSDHPVIFRDLLSANSLYNEGMYVDPGKLGFRLNIANAYIVYAMLCAIILIPLFTVWHFLFTDLNLHISLIGVIAATSMVFIGFNFFRAYMRDKMTLKLIKKAWRVHFPYFAYDKYSKKIEKIYNDSLKDEVSKKDLQQYVMEKVVHEDN